MALNKLKKWIGTQAMTAFFDQLNDNVDATNAAIDLAEQNEANISLLGNNILYREFSLQKNTAHEFTLANNGLYLLFVGASREARSALYIVVRYSATEIHLNPVKTDGAIAVTTITGGVRVAPSLWYRAILWRISG